MRELTHFEIEQIWREHRHSPAAGTWEQLAGDAEVANCDCGERIVRRDITIEGKRYATTWQEVSR